MNNYQVRQLLKGYNLDEDQADVVQDCINEFAEENDIDRPDWTLYRFLEEFLELINLPDTSQMYTEDYVDEIKDDAYQEGYDDGYLEGTNE